MRNREDIRAPNRYEACVTVHGTPRIYQEALNCDDSALWKQAIDEELQAHIKNKTWDVAELPDSQKPIGFTWVFNVKDLNDKISKRYKTRLYAQGFAHEPRIDYKEIFSPVV